jgi:hypothetical protein
MNGIGFKIFRGQAKESSAKDLNLPAGKCPGVKILFK